MKVWVAEQGCYEDREVVGVYSTVEAAMQAHPIPKEPPLHCRFGMRVPGWAQSSEGEWRNGLDWEERIDIFAIEMDS